MIKKTNLVNIIGVDGGVKTGVQIVQQIHHLKRSRIRRDCRETDDVRKVNRDFSELFRIHRHAEFELVCDGAVNRKFSNLLTE